MWDSVCETYIIWLERERVSAVRLCVRRTLSGWNESEYRLWESVCETYIIWLERERVSAVRVCVWDVHYLAGTRESIGCESLCVRRTLSGWNESEYRMWDSVCKTYIIWLERERVSAVRLCETYIIWLERERVLAVRVCVWDVHYLAGTRESIGCESLCVRRTLSGWNESEYRMWDSVCKTYIIWLERERVSAVRLCVRHTLSGWNESEYRLWESVCKTYIIWLERERVSAVRVCVWDVHYLAGTRESIGCESLCVRRTLSGWSEREYRLWDSVCKTYIIWLERERVSTVRVCV